MPPEIYAGGMGARSAMWPTAAGPAALQHRAWPMLQDCFEVVLGYLDPADIALCREVCSAWRQQVQLLLWHLAPRPGCDLAAVATTFPSLTTIQLDLRPSPSPPASAAASGSQPSSSCQACPALAALAGLKRMRRLALRATTPAAADLDTDALLPLAQLPHLWELSLQGFRLRGCSSLRQLTQLRSLALSGVCIEDWDASLAALLAPLTRLEAICFSGYLRGGGSGPGEAPFAGLSCLSALTAVRLGGGALVDDDTCRQLAALPHLAHIELSRSDQDANSALTVTDDGVAAFAALDSQLVRLVLLGHTGITDAGLLWIRRLTRLEHLDLRLHSWDARPPPVPGISNEGISHLAALPRLRALKLGWCSLGESGAESIASLTGLTSLDLHSCPGLRDAALFKLRRLPALHRLSLRGCVGVSDIGLAALARQLQRQLLELDLTGCHKNVSDAGLASLRCMRLRSLELAHCEAVSDAGLELLLSGPLGRSLQRLDCRDCSQLTDRACALLAAYARGLCWLSLEHCPRLGAGGLAQLASLPALREVQLCGSGVAPAAAEVGGGLRGRRLRVVLRKHQVWWAPA